MSINCNQVREVVIKPALMALGLYSDSALNLLLGTCAQESGMGRFLIQKRIGFKGGIGIFQCEKIAYENVWDKMVAPSAAMKAKIKLYLGYEGRPPAERMATDLGLACVMARLYYFAINKPLPAEDDIAGLAAYWKKWYNTDMGGGTEQEFIANYAHYITKGLL